MKAGRDGHTRQRNFSLPSSRRCRRQLNTREFVPVAKEKSCFRSSSPFAWRICSLLTLVRTTRVRVTPSTRFPPGPDALLHRLASLSFQLLVCHRVHEFCELRVGQVRADFTESLCNVVPDLVPPRFQKRF